MIVLFNRKIWLESLLARTWKSRRAHPAKPFPYRKDKPLQT